MSKVLLGRSWRLTDTLRITGNSGNFLLVSSKFENTISKPHLLKVHVMHGSTFRSCLRCHSTVVSQSMSFLNSCPATCSSTCSTGDICGRDQNKGSGWNYPDLVTLVFVISVSSVLKFLSHIFLDTPNRIYRYEISQSCGGQVGLFDHTGHVRCSLCWKCLNTLM